jgi:transposase
MAKRGRPDPKAESLKQYGCLHPRPEGVKDALFLTNDFFDPRDLTQVKYEMLRRVRVESWSVTQASEVFGFARSSFYEALTAYEKEGLVGLLPQRRGPQAAHKLSDEVMEYIDELLQNEYMNAKQLAAALQKKFELVVHPRSIERALSKKKRSPTEPP